jgi:hypothetical protein
MASRAQLDEALDDRSGPRLIDLDGREHDAQVVEQPRLRGERDALPERVPEQGSGLVPRAVRARCAILPAAIVST